MGKSGVRHTGSGVYNAEEIAAMQRAIEAVCTELGIRRSDQESRERVADHVIRSWAKGRRMPLNLVHAGLEGGTRPNA